MKFLVTGASGFIGSNLCRHLLKEKHEVFGMDNFYSSSEENIAELKEQEAFQFLKHDIREDFPEEVKTFNPDIIINLACPASPPQYQQDPIYTWETSILGTRNCLKAAVDSDATLLHASTSEVYGNPQENPQKESYWGHVNPIGIRSCYDESKRAAETLLMDASRTKLAKIKIFRIFNTYGPYMAAEDGRVVSNMIVQALKNKDLTIYGDGKQTRSFQYIDDLIAGIMALAESPSEVTGPINLGNPEELSIDALADKILALTSKAKGQIIQSEKIYQDLPEDDPMQRCPDISLAKKLLDWEPQTPLNDGLLRTINYFVQL